MTTNWRLKSRRALKQITLMLCLAGIGACGAPVKKSNTIGQSTFNAKTLGEKASTLCAQLKERTLAPTLQASNIKISACAEAGLAAQNIKDGLAPTGLQFVSTTVGSGSQKILQISARNQLWLNHGILELAQRITTLVKNNNGNKAEETVHFLGKAAGGNAPAALQPSSLVTTKFTLQKAMQFNQKDLEFQLGAIVDISGAVKVNNPLKLSAKVFTDSIAATIETTEDRSFEQSLFKKMNGLILVIPHANDIYIDTFLNIEVNSFGLDSVVQNAFRSALSNALEAVGKLILSFETKQ